MGVLGAFNADSHIPFAAFLAPSTMRASGPP